MFKVARECLEAFRVYEMVKNDKVWYLYYVHIRPFHLGECTLLRPFHMVECTLTWSNGILSTPNPRFAPFTRVEPGVLSRFAHSIGRTRTHVFLVFQFVVFNAF